MSMASSSMAGGGSNDGLLALVLTAGQDDTFKTRLADLIRAKQEAEQAFADLRIGNDAKAAFEKANADRVEAEALLVSARAQAKEIVASASATAATVKSKADTKARDIIAAAEAKSADMAANAAALEGETQKMRDALSEEITTARVATAAATAAQATAEDQKAQLERAMRATEEKLVRLNGVAAQLRDVFKEI